MKVTVVRVNELSSGEMRTWSDVQARNDLFNSPYFCPHFSAAVGCVREDVFVAIIEERTRVEGFFPFQLKSPGKAVPVGAKVSDYHGVIVSNDLDWQVEDLFCRCKLSSWKFDHLPVAQSQFTKYHGQVEISPVIDLSKEAVPQWVSALEERGSSLLQQLRAACRRLEREHGPVRFEPQISDPALLAQLLHSKSAQYTATRCPDLF